VDWQGMLFQNWSGIVRTLLVGTLAYVTLVLFLRISGKRTLAKLNAFDLVVTVALGSTLSAILLQESIALAEGAAALALLIGLRRRAVYVPQAGWLAFALRLVPALAGLAALLWYADSRIDWIALQAHAGQRAALLAGVLAASGVVYFGLLLLFGFRPRDFGRRPKQ